MSTTSSPAVRFDDVRLLRHGVLRHRLVLTYDALADGIAPEAIIDAIFAAVPTP